MGRSRISIEHARVRVFLMRGGLFNIIKKLRDFRVKLVVIENLFTIKIFFYQCTHMIVSYY